MVVLLNMWNLRKITFAPSWKVVKYEINLCAFTTQSVLCVAVSQISPKWLTTNFYKHHVVINFYKGKHGRAIGSFLVNIKLTFTRPSTSCALTKPQHLLSACNNRKPEIVLRTHVNEESLLLSPTTQYTLYCCIGWHFLVSSATTCWLPFVPTYASIEV